MKLILHNAENWFFLDTAFSSSQSQRHPRWSSHQTLETFSWLWHWWQKKYEKFYDLFDFSSACWFTPLHNLEINFHFPKTEPSRSGIFCVWNVKIKNNYSVRESRHDTTFPMTKWNQLKSHCVSFEDDLFARWNWTDNTKNQRQQFFL